MKLKFIVKISEQIYANFIKLFFYNFKMHLFQMEIISLCIVYNNVNSKSQKLSIVEIETAETNP